MSLLPNLSNLLNLLVHLYSMVISSLPSSGHSKGHVSRVPCFDTCNLAETTVGLAKQPCSSSSSHHTLVAMTLGNFNSINHFILAKDAIILHNLLKKQ